MNNARRKEIQSALKVVLDGRIENDLEEAKSNIETARDDEQEYYDNMPEGLQGSEKGERAQSAIDALEEILSKLDDMIEALGEIQGNLDTATE